MKLKDLKPGQSFAILGELQICADNRPNDGGLRIFKKVVMASNDPAPPQGQVLATSDDLVWIFSEQEKVIHCHV